MQLVTADNIGRVISEFLDNRPIVEKWEAEEILLMATADLFASAFGFNQSQNQHQEQKKENPVRKSKTKRRKRLILKLFWRKRRKS